MSALDDHSASVECTPSNVADVLAALGELMRDLHHQDLALQNAVSKIASNASNEGAEVAHIQHIDLVTQTHDDLARFLPELAAALESTNFDPKRLAKILRLQSLRDQLLSDGNTDDAKTPSGELSLF